MNKNLSKSVKILILKEIALQCFTLFFLFWRLINKNVLEWFLLITCKEHTLTRSTTHFILVETDAQYWTVTSSNCQKQPLEVFYKKALLTNFATFTGKHLHWSLFLIKLPAFRPVTLLERDSNTIVFLFRNFKENLIWRMILNWLYEVIVWNVIAG